MPEEKKEQEYKVSWKGWLSLLFICISFSGVTLFVTEPTSAWRALDFSVLVGKFGTIAGSKNHFQGAGGVGSRDGFLFALTLFPTVMLALGLIQVCESLGALRAAEKIFRPLLRPVMGIPGVAGLAFVSSFTSSDVGAVMTKDLVESKMMTDDERTIFVAYQYAGSATVTNTFGTGAALLPISVLPVGFIIGIIFVCKVIGSFLVRLFLIYYRMKNPVKGGAE